MFTVRVHPCPKAIDPARNAVPYVAPYCAGTIINGLAKNRPKARSYAAAVTIFLVSAHGIAD